jgi:hypothetical protein
VTKLQRVIRTPAAVLLHERQLTGWQVAERLLTASPGSGAVSAEDRALDFEVKVPTAASGQVQLSAYACYYACESAQGKCRFLRLDVPVTIHLAQ